MRQRSHVTGMFGLVERALSLGLSCDATPLTVTRSKKLAGGHDVSTGYQPVCSMTSKLLLSVLSRWLKASFKPSQDDACQGLSPMSSCCSFSPRGEGRDEGARACVDRHDGLSSAIIGGSAAPALTPTLSRNGRGGSDVLTCEIAL